ncbi:MAG: universal stress protein [Armatimonadota bacterium]|nr:universal stress protein [Armatimonadota bacterium]
MLNTIVVGTDFSKPSLAVLDCVPRLKAAGVERVILAHVAHVVNTPGLEEAIINEARPLLEGQADRLREVGVEVETALPVGVPAVELADLAEERGASAIVVGSHGRSMLSRIFLGSVSMSLLHHATVPVLLVRMELCNTDEGVSCELQCAEPFAHILFPTDFSEAADQAVAWLKRAVAQTGAPVTLLHVQERVVMKHQMERLEEFNREDTERLERIAEELRAAGAREVAHELRLGMPAQVIVEVAADAQASLIAMSTHGRGAYEDMVLGSVALKVARTSPVPVLMFPHR